MSHRCGSAGRVRRDPTLTCRLRRCLHSGLCGFFTPKPGWYTVCYRPGRCCAGMRARPLEMAHHIRHETKLFKEFAMSPKGSAELRSVGEEAPQPMKLSNS